MTEDMEKCIEDCRTCAEMCASTIEHCKQMGGKHAEAAHLRLLADCSEICTTSENFMRRDSEHAPEVCMLCASICDDCAESCETLDPEDAEMLKCAEACRTCAVSCREM